jgi:hypothetical protein
MEKLGFRHKKPVPTEQKAAENMPAVQAPQKVQPAPAKPTLEWVDPANIPTKEEVEAAERAKKEAKAAEEKARYESDFTAFANHIADEVLTSLEKRSSADKPFGLPLSVSPSRDAKAELQAARTYTYKDKPYADLFVPILEKAISDKTHGEFALATHAPVVGTPPSVRVTVTEAQPGELVERLHQTRESAYNSRLDTAVEKVLETIKYQLQERAKNYQPLEDAFDIGYYSKDGVVQIPGMSINVSNRPEFVADLEAKLREAIPASSKRYRLESLTVGPRHWNAANVVVAGMKTNTRHVDRVLQLTLGVIQDTWSR